MIDAERSRELQCGYILKILIIFLASTGVFLSLLASNSCQFLYFGSETFLEIDSTFDGWRGIFKYETISNINEKTAVEQCSIYENLLKIDAANEALFASQLCAIMAPGLASIAIVVSTIELICCKFFGGFISASVLFLAATLFQCGTFGVFLIEQGLCFDSDGCEIGHATYFSASAMLAFCTSCILLCCSPRPRPCMQIKNQSKINDYIQEYAPSKGAGDGRETQ